MMQEASGAGGDGDDFTIAGDVEAVERADR